MPGDNFKWFLNPFCKVIFFAYKINYIYFLYVISENDLYLEWRKY